ncbi:MAG: NAD(P)-dependent oxidoreductase, partial [Betaproteobacteria bacterium]|nr:NAD(P)-dependent oxidoreductase [Betaproteobacteria bacterium]
MNEHCAGLLGATSLVGECLIKRLTGHDWHVTAFSRRSITNLTPHPQIVWRQLDTLGRVKDCDEKHEIHTWLCVAPIWILPEYFGLLSAYNARRIIVLSSTSRFTKVTS